MESQQLDWSHLIQLCACLGNLGLKSILFHCDLCLRLFFSIFKNFFFLNFNSILKADHVLDCNTLCKRDIFIGFIIWFQISKCLVCNIWTKLVLWKCCQCLIPSLQSAWDGNSIFTYIRVIMEHTWYFPFLKNLTLHSCRLWCYIE